MTISLPLSLSDNYTQRMWKRSLFPTFFGRYRLNLVLIFCSSKCLQRKTSFSSQLHFIFYFSLNGCQADIKRVSVCTHTSKFARTLESLVYSVINSSMRNALSNNYSRGLYQRQHLSWNCLCKSQNLQLRFCVNVAPYVFFSFF